MKLFVRRSSAALLLLVAESVSVRESIPVSAAELQVRLADGRTLLGSLVEKKTDANQLTIEARAAGNSIRRTFAWKQIASVKVLPPREEYEPHEPVRPEVVSESASSHTNKPPHLPLSELVVSAQPVSTFGKLDWDSLRLSLRGLDQRGQSVPLFGTLTITLWGQRQEVVRINQDQTTTIPRQIEQLATWTRSLDSTIEQFAGVAVPVGARQGRSGAAYEDLSKRSWGTSSEFVHSQNPTNITGQHGRGRTIYENDPPDILQMILPLPQPLPDQDARRSPIGEVSVELLMPGVGVFSAASSGVAIAHQSPLRQFQLERTGTRFFPNEATTDNQSQFGSITNRTLWPERRTLSILP